MIRQKLVIAIGVLTLTLLPMTRPVFAQSTSTPGAVSEILKTLELTPEQQPKVDQIQANAAVKIKGILNSDQLKQLQEISEKGTASSEAFKSLSLTPEQKTKLNAVQMGVAQELFTVLTPDQQQKLIDQMIARSGKKTTPQTTSPQ